MGPVQHCHSASLIFHSLNPPPSLTPPGGKISAMDRSGLTPLMVAAAYGNLESVRKLLKLGASVALTDKRGFSAVHFAAEKGRLPVRHSRRLLRAQVRAR